MLKIDFILNKAALLNALLSRGPLSFHDGRNPEFKGMRWITEDNLTFDEIDLIQVNGLVVGEVAIVDGGLAVDIMFDKDLRELNCKPSQA